MNHSTVHDAGHNTVVKLIHFESNTLEKTEQEFDPTLVKHTVVSFFFFMV